jgi:uncharacterized protein
MPLEVRLSDLVRLGLVEAFEAEHEDPSRIAKRLQKAKLIDRFHHKHGIFDAHTRLCTVYPQRPGTCRLHPQKGPRPGFCPYGAKAQSQR